jgi:hypothetical protein
VACRVLALSILKYLWPKNAATFTRLLGAATRPCFQDLTTVG